MKEYPIIFRGDMIQALIRGDKTQTRRLLNPQPPEGYLPWADYASNEAAYRIFTRGGLGDLYEKGWTIRSPYGSPGDRLWVRETHKLGHDSISGAVKYRADGHVRPGLGDFEFEKWRPSIHMNREHSRFLLEVENVKIERLQSITEEDAIAEGINSAPCDQTIMYQNYADDTWFEDWMELYGKAAILSYKSLWDQLNAKKAPWDTNPWVWKVTFRRLYEAVRAERESTTQSDHERSSV